MRVTNLNQFFSFRSLYLAENNAFIQASLCFYLIIKTVASIINPDIKFKGLFRGPLLQN